MKMVTAVIRTTSLQRILRLLSDLNIKGVTVSEVRGTGDQAIISGDLAVHDRIDIIVDDDKAETVSGLIAENAHTGLPGDGVVAIVPLDYMVEIRTGEKKEH